MAGNIRLKVIERKKEFLRLFREEISIAATCRRMNITKNCNFHWCHRDPEFVRAMTRAREDVADNLAAESLRRAYTGILEDVYYRGSVIGQKRRYSDRMLIFLLKWLLPEKYGNGSRAESPDAEPPIILNFVPAEEFRGFD
jgi:hypothetical protein